MLVIRPEQMNTFEQEAMRHFEDKMVFHAQDFSPVLSKILGDSQLRAALRSGITRAMSYGFTYRGPIRLFIEMMFLCGSGFDSDPQYSTIGTILRSPDMQMQRAELIHQCQLDYLEKVSGPGALNVHRALRDLAYFAQRPVKFSRENFVQGMLAEMDSIFPQKTAYIGKEQLSVLIRSGQESARNFGFTDIRGEVLMVVLMFAFGHGCTDDPLYPWISNTLRDNRIVNPEARAKRLEKKALTWLRHVNARNQKKALLL